MTQQLCNNSRMRDCGHQKKLITKYGNCNKTYFDQKYKFVCPERLNQKIYLFDKYHKITSNISTTAYIFVDVDVQ